MNIIKNLSLSVLPYTFCFLRKWYLSPIVFFFYILYHISVVSCVDDFWTSGKAACDIDCSAYPNEDVCAGALCADGSTRYHCEGWDEICAGREKREKEKKKHDGNNN